MQAVSVSPNLSFHAFSKEFAEVSEEMMEEFNAKLRFGGSVSESEDLEENELVGEDEEEEEVEVEEEEEEEFSFFCTDPDGSPISAEEIFKDGQIRPVFPIFDRSLLFAEEDLTVSSSSSAAAAGYVRPPLKKLFVEDHGGEGEGEDELDGAEPGTYCEWRGKAAAEASPEMRKKSNSTGFSRLWRFRDLVVRSSSDGKDAFVFLKPAPEKEVKDTSTPTPPPAPAAITIMKKTATAKKKKKSETVSSAHERHYVRNRAKKEEDKRRSYLPYRPGLVGFFANVNGFSRNVHPF